MIVAKVVGAGGYGGVGIIELLTGHPEVRISTLVSLSDAGKSISEVYPHLEGFCDIVVAEPGSPEAEAPADVVFFSTPDQVGMKLAHAELERGAKIIDYSGDFRFKDLSAYAEYATRIGKNPEHTSPELLDESVYGLTELHREEIRHARLVGNPGCLAVSCILGLAPAVKNKFIELDNIICDCKTGVSGGGKKPSASFHYPARYDHMNAYKLAGHQHVLEVERELTVLAGEEARVTFTAQVVPVCRGIMSTRYARASAKITVADLLEAYRSFYKGSAFVQVYDRSANIGSAHVRGTNYCKIIVDFDERTNCVRIISHVDNLLKGQAGSALQNMNVMFGLPETEGLLSVPKYP